MKTLLQLKNTCLIHHCKYSQGWEMPIKFSLEEVSSVFEELPLGIATAYVNKDGESHKYNQVYQCNGLTLLFDLTRDGDNYYSVMLFFDDILLESIFLKFTSFQSMETFIMSNWRLKEVELKPYTPYKERK